MSTPLLSVIVPVYNEAQTIRLILEKIESINIDKEIIAVDDGSTDQTAAILRGIAYPRLKIIHHTSNRGKGAAFLTGLSHATGEFVIIQDADLEYDPADYLKLLEVIREKRADLVLGARFTKGYHGLFIHRLGNKFLTSVMNLFFAAKLNDCFTCYKLFRRDAALLLSLKSQKFDLDTEIIAKALHNKWRIEEVPVSYHPRTYSQGKKIRLRDGLKAVWAILKCRFSTF
ncbi:MAG: glycosyltransferase family 2 protein [Candidatus Omnitrophica bacterium]|nr:glycosyltransferase family 2 protein [Candidatus Omnitrophota bacterium]